MHGEVPRWIPFLVHGVIANGFYAMQSGLTQNLLMAAGPILKHCNFLTLFYAGMFVDEFLLLLGTWLLAKRYFKSSFTVFFVCVSVIGSSIWIGQPWFNFHFYYAVPLIIYFFHQFLDTKKWYHFFLAANLFIFQTLGNLVYLIPFTSLVIFAYFLFYFVLNYKTVIKQSSQITYSRLLPVFLLWAIAMVAAGYFILSFGMDQIAYYGDLRNRDGTVTAEMFLQTGSQVTKSYLADLAFGTAAHINFTLYAGAAAIFMAILAVMINWNRQKAIFIMLIVFTYLFSRGTLISVFSYYVWPMMKYFRHIQLTVSFSKLFFCFLAGFGFEALLIEQNNSRRIKLSLAFLFFFLLLALFFLTNNQGLVSKGFQNMDYRGGLWAAVAGVSCFLALITGRSKWPKFFITFILLVQVVSIFSYKFQLFYDGSVRLNRTQYELLQFSELPFVKDRRESYAEREPILGNLYEFFFKKSGPAKYFTILPFLFKDEFNSWFIANQWMVPLDYLIKAYRGLSIYDRQADPTPTFQDNHVLTMPRGHPAIQKIGGLSEDKIQFFSTAYIFDSLVTVASNLTNPKYQGDILFLFSAEDKKSDDVNERRHFDQPLDSNTRLRLPYEVKYFDSNQIKVSVNIPGSDSAWLYYSDVWHPFWKATVNGKSRTVFRADLAYKAVRLDPGKNEVHFYFESKLISFLHIFFALHSVLWLCVAAWLAFKICFREDEDLPNGLAAA